ncbi:MAG: metallophosphoesterase [Spirochaetes bacterium]|nr:metallophosphoesterase [Spirochaetota bacterium]
MSEKAMERLLAVSEIVRTMDETLRPRAVDGMPGGLVTFPPDDKRDIVIVGDLHANTDNLKRVMHHDHLLNRIRANEAVLVLLGDAFHESRASHLDEMESSLMMLDLLFRLFVEAPAGVLYLRGNHDSFSSTYMKGGVAQGMVFRLYLKRKRGDEYVARMEDFFQLLPYFIMHPKFVAMHAGPPHGGVKREDIINIRANESVRRALVWNRINELNLPPHESLYGNSDLEMMRSSLGCPPDIPVIVGHNPMRRGIDGDGVWENLHGCHNHVILTSDQERRCPTIVFRGSGTYEVIYV